jgi:uncharacterized protein (TIGR03067 family)
MKRLLVAVLLAGFVGGTSSNLVGTPTPESYAKKQRATLEGTWSVVTTTGYDPTVVEEIQTLRLTFQDETLTAAYGNKKVEGTYRLILTEAGPSQIDITVTRGPEAVQGKTFPGIYLLEHHTLTIYYVHPGKPRPAMFTAEKKPGVYTLFFKKEQ